MALSDLELDVFALELRAELQRHGPGVLNVGVGVTDAGEPKFVVYVQRRSNFPRDRIPMMFHDVPVAVTSASSPRLATS